MILFSLAEFIFVAIFLIFPPLINAPENEVLTLDFSKGYSISTYAVFLVSLFIFAERNYSEKKNNKKSVSNAKKSSLIEKTSVGTVCLGAIFIVSAVFQAFSLLENKGSFKSQTIIFPESFFYFASFFTGTFFAAFSEEVIYRFYLPDALKNNIKILSLGRLNCEKSKALNLLFELLSVCIFALSHRYLGLLSVFNAFFSGFILRFCLIKSKSVFVPFLIHSVYNFSVFLFARFIS